MLYPLSYERGMNHAEFRRVGRRTWRATLRTPTASSSGRSPGRRALGVSNLTAVRGLKLVGTIGFGVMLAISTAVPAFGASTGPSERFSVGRLTVTFVDTSRPTPANGSYPGAPSRTLPTLVSYPTQGSRPAPGPRPLVVFATGIGDSPTTYQALFDRWVRAGYVVAEPAFPLSNDQAPGGSTAADFTHQPADISFVITKLLEANRSASSRLHGLINPKQIGLAGKSLGAITAFEVAYNPASRDPRVKAVIAMTGFVGVSGPHFVGITTPLLLEHGDADTTAPIQGSRDAYAQANPPKFFVTLFGQTHSSAFGGGTKPAEQVVERTTLDFLDHYVAGQASALARLQRDGTVAGVSSLQSTP
jgi:dienelactone hydrolase